MSCKSKMHFHKFHLLSIAPKLCKIKPLHFHNKKGELLEGKKPQTICILLQYIFVCNKDYSMSSLPN